MKTALEARAMWFFTVLLLAILLTCLHLALTEPWRLASLTRLVNFEAAEPFQHRLLLPAAVIGLQAFLPFGEELLFALLEVLGWMALMVVAHQALVTLKVGTSSLARRALAVTVTIPMALHLIVPNLQFRPLYVLDGNILELGDWKAERLFYYAYDLPAAVFTLALVLILMRYLRERDSRWLTLYLGVFALATLNRETTLFLIPVFATVLYRVLEGRRLIKALALQIGVFVLIQGLLQWSFADHINPSARIPGTHYEYHLIKNLAWFSDPLYLITYLARFGAGLYIPILLFHSRLDPALGRALLWFGIPLIAFAFLMGRIVELRVFIELVPLIWLGGIQVLAAQRPAAAIRRPVPLAVESIARHHVPPPLLRPVNGGRRAKKPAEDL